MWKSDLRTYTGVRADKCNARSQGRAGATEFNDTFGCLKKGNFVQGQKGDAVSARGVGESISRMWCSAAPEQPPLMSVAQKDAEKLGKKHTEFEGLERDCVGRV